MVRARGFLGVVSVLSVLVLAAAGGIARAGDSAQATTDTLQSLQGRIQSDPQLMSAVQSLSDNPEMQDVLADPAIAAALSQGDVAALLANPKIKHLAEDPAVQKITRQLAE